METQSNSPQNLNVNETELSNQEGNTAESLKTETTGIQYHNYAPKHSSHGRANTRGFGSDHEPGTMR